MARNRKVVGGGTGEEHTLSAPTRPGVSNDLIAMRAYEKWTARGCPAGDDLRDWREAEQELLGDVSTAPPPKGSTSRRGAP